MREGIETGAFAGLGALGMYAGSFTGPGVIVAVPVLGVVGA